MTSTWSKSGIWRSGICRSKKFILAIFDFLSVAASLYLPKQGKSVALHIIPPGSRHYNGGAGAQYNFWDIAALMQKGRNWIYRAEVA